MPMIIPTYVYIFSFDRAPFASPKRKALGSYRDDSEEKEMAIALKEALEATVCMVSYQFHIAQSIGKDILPWWEIQINFLK